MKRLLHILLIIALIPFFNYSCKKGCTDVEACNYDAEAKKDNGTCNYGCKVTASECTNGEKKFYDILAQKNINCFDNTTVFAVLTLTQNRFQTCSNGTFGLNGYVENIIKFKNVTSSTITFDYNITQNYSGNFKEYQGYISKLAPGQSEEINTGDNTFYNLNNSTIQVVGASIVYE